MQFFSGEGHGWFLEFLARSEWPIVVGGALWYLKAPLREIISGIKRGKLGVPGLAEIDWTLNKVEELVPAVQAKVELTAA